MVVPELKLDALQRVVFVGSSAVDLTPREAELMEFLLARRGQLVLRETLEREVWGFAPGVRSESVPVMVRRLRQRLGEAGVLLQTVRGEGWVLQGTQPRAAVETGPRFGTPYLPRASDQGAVLDCLEQGWQIVTLVGPGGAGKSRLAAWVCKEVGGVWVALAGAATEDEVLTRVGRALGTDGTLQATVAALAHRPRVLVLDEAEAIVPLVVSMLERLPCRAVVTSRQDLGLQTAAVVPVSGLSGPAGRAFVEARLAATRWGAPPEPELVDRALELFDGLPLALEVAAAHPLGLAGLVERIEQGRGLPSDRLSQTFASSLERLTPAERRVLEALAICDTTFSSHDLVDWLGDDAMEAVHSLAARSLMVRQGGRWALLRILRRLVLAEMGDREPLRRSADAWLVKRARALADGALTDPRRNLDAWEPLIPAIVEALDRLDAAECFELVDDIMRFSHTRGPESLCRRALVRARQRHPDDARLAVYDDWLLGLIPDEARIEALLNAPDVRPRIVGTEILLTHDPTALVDDALDAVVVACEQPADRARARLIQVLRGIRTTPTRSFFAAQHAALAPYRWLQWAVEEDWCRALLRAGEARSCVGRAEPLIAELEQAGCRIEALRVRLLRADALSLFDLEAAAASFEALLDEQEASGSVTSARRSRIRLAVIALARGDAARCLALLDVAPSNHPTSERVAAGVRMVARRVSGDVEAGARLASWKSEPLIVMGVDLGTFWVRILGAFGHLDTDREAAKVLHAELQEAPDGVYEAPSFILMVRLLGQLLE